MLRNIGGEPKSPLLEVSNFFIHFQLLSLSGMRGQKKVKIILFKGIQKADSTKHSYDMKEGSVKFEEPGLEVSIYNFNIKKPNNSELLLTLYEIQSEEEEHENGTIILPVATLINAFLENKSQKQKGTPAHIQKKDKIGGYTLQYVIYIDKNKHNIQTYLKANVKPKEEPKKESIPVQQPQEVAPLVEEVKEVKQTKVQKGKMRQINQEQIEAKEQELPPRIELTVPKTKEQQQSLLNVTQEPLPVPPAEETPPVEEDGKVNKKDLGIIQAQSVTDTQITNNLTPIKEKPEKVEAQKVAETNKKLIVVIVVAIAFIYLFFIRGRGTKPVKAPAKPSVKTSAKEPKGTAKQKKKPKE